MEEPEAKQKIKELKTGYKKGIIRIWQKMAEYQPISLTKAMQYKT